MAFEDCVCIVFFAVLTTLLSEGISWALVYRKESYKRLTLGMEKATKVNIFIDLSYAGSKVRGHMSLRIRGQKIFVFYFSRSHI